MIGRRREGDRSRCGELERVGLMCFLSSEGAQRLKKKHGGQGDEIQGDVSIEKRQLGDPDLKQKEPVWLGLSGREGDDEEDRHVVDKRHTSRISTIWRVRVSQATKSVLPKHSRRPLQHHPSDRMPLFSKFIRSLVPDSPRHGRRPSRLGSSGPIMKQSNEELQAFFNTQLERASALAQQHPELMSTRVWLQICSMNVQIYESVMGTYKVESTVNGQPLVMGHLIDFAIAVRRVARYMKSLLGVPITVKFQATFEGTFLELPYTTDALPVYERHDGLPPAAEIRKDIWRWLKTYTGEVKKLLDNTLRFATLRAALEDEIERVVKEYEKMRHDYVGWTTLAEDTHAQIRVTWTDMEDYDSSDEESESGSVEEEELGVTERSKLKALMRRYSVLRERYRELAELGIKADLSDIREKIRREDNDAANFVDDHGALPPKKRKLSDTRAAGGSSGEQRTVPLRRDEGEGGSAEAGGSGERRTVPLLRAQGEGRGGAAGDQEGGAQRETE